MIKSKNIFKILIWPIIFIIGQFLIRYIFASAFNYSIKGNLTDKEFLDYINTSDYKILLEQFINNNTIYIIIITSLIFIPLFYNVYKKYRVKNNFKINNLFVPLLFGVSISLIYNILLFYLNSIFNFTSKFEVSNLSIIIQILSSGILGPIIEELIFRGIIYNKLKNTLKPMKAIIFTSLVFGLFHSNIIDAIYAFGVSFILIYLYEKYKTLKAPILMHIALNITIILMVNLIIMNYLIFNIYLFIISIIILLILRVTIIEKRS